tara:strand:+ start:381 stop:572 length:192 start_codon:yes stop_codon:yes gene_type:complete
VLIALMSIKSLIRSSEVVETSIRVNVDVLKKRIIDQKKKERVKATIIFSTVLVSISALTYLTY